MSRKELEALAKGIESMVREESGDRLHAQVHVSDSETPLVTIYFSGDGVSGANNSDPESPKVRWFPPVRGMIRDGDGHVWALPLIGRLRPQENSEGDPGAPDETESDKKKNSKKYYEPFKAESVPDLDAMVCRPAWEADARRAKALSEREKLNESSFWKLEARLNAPWTSGGARLEMRATLVADGDRGNPLKGLEGPRTLVLPFKGGDGRLRLPHRSHFRLLCPFATPESRDIGLHLFLAADGKRDGATGTFTPPQEGAPLFSFEVGMVPYATHSDGPRIMMGGKNLKQAEEVCGSEPAEVPGVLEGDRGATIFDPDNFKQGRLYPHLGVNAWVGVLPYGGFTYEDGLVVSEAFARRMAFDDIYRQRVVMPLGVSEAPDEGGLLDTLKNLDFDMMRREFAEGGISTEGVLWGGGEKKTLVFGDELPLPPRIKEAFEKGQIPFCHRYDHHEAGQLHDVRLRLIFRRPEGGGAGAAAETLSDPGTCVDAAASEAPEKTGKRKGAKPRRQGVALELDYRFKVTRPLRVGDKLTGRHGNKGVVTKILPDDLMPTVELGGQRIPLEVLISPSSIIGRKNVGQLAEMLHALGLWAQEKGFLDKAKGKVASHRGLTSAELETLLGRLREVLNLDEDGKALLGVPEGGKERGGRAFVGRQYVARLRHHAAAKLQARGTRGPIVPKLGQAAPGGARAGQRLGEMENWGILSHSLAWDGALDLLLALRGQEGPPEATRDTLRRLLFALGLGLTWEKGSCQVEGAQGEACSLGEAQEAQDRVVSALLAFEDEEKQKEAEREAQKLRIVAVPQDDRERLIKELPAFLKKHGVKEDAAEVRSLREAWRKRLGGEPHRMESALEEGFRKAEQAFPVPDHPSEGEPLAEEAPKGDGKKRPPRIPLHGLVLLAARDGGGNLGVPFVAEAATLSPQVNRGYSVLWKALENWGSASPQERPFEKRRGDDPVPPWAREPLGWVVDAMNKLHDALEALLSGKEKLLRRHVLGRRLGASGRGVIVPDPTLPLDEVRLPGRMVAELLQGHDLERRYDLNDTMRKSFHGEDESRRQEALDELAKCLELHPLWVLMIRQPTLHRQNVQAFRVRVWDEWALALPPFITAGFNADFDGDTMAVFLPPAPWCEDLSFLSPLENPGRIGEGDLAYQTKLDLALGWEALDEKGKMEWAQRASLSGGKVSLEDVVKGLPGRGKELLELQRAVCAASTASCSLPPGEFFRCARDLKEKREELLKNVELSSGGDDLKKVEKSADKAVGDWLKGPGRETSLARLIGSKARGKESDLRQICLFLGYQENFVETEGLVPGAEPQPGTSGGGAGGLSERAAKALDLSEPFPQVGWISGAFWPGLSDEELFRYAYASRGAMTSKKLAVAEAGYLARLLAEGLYDVMVTEEDCRAPREKGLVLAWVPEGERIEILRAAGEPVGAVLPGSSPERVLENVAWGRVPAGMDRPLGNADLKAILAFWRKALSMPIKEDLLKVLQEEENTLVLRSPLGCEAKTGLCARCWGADPAQRLLRGENPPWPKIKSAVGLVSAMALGERGTQLSMRRFHQVGAGGQVSIPDLRALLVDGKELPKKDQAGNTLAGKTASAPARLKSLLRDILTSGSSRCDELPQVLVHFETALRFSGDPAMARRRHL